MARDLRGTLSYGPEFFEQRYVFRIPTHGRYYNADCQLQASLVFVRLAHDRRFVGVVLFFLIVIFLIVIFVIVIFVFIRISRRHRVAHDHEGTPVDQPVGKFVGDVLLRVVAPRAWTPGDFTPFCSGFCVRVTAAPFAEHRQRRARPDEEAQFRIAE
jgi:hypothetical protein